MKIDVILGAGLTAGEISELGVLAERYDIQTFWNQSFPACRDPLLTMAAGLVGATRTIRLGTLPVSPYEVHPQRIADSILTFNELAGGRAAILIGGLGHSVMRVAGLDAEQRVASVRDCVTILKSIRPDEMLNYKGPRYSTMNYQPRWAIEPPPLIYVGASGPNMLKMSAETADGIMMSDVPLERMPEVLLRVEDGLKKNQHSREHFRLNNFFAWHVKENAEESYREARRELVWRGFLKRWYTEPFLGAENAKMVEDRKDVFLQAFFQRSDEFAGIPDGIVNDLVANLTFAGGLDRIDHVIEHLKAFAAAGLDEIALKVHDDPADAIKLIGEHIVPALQ